MGVLQLIHNTSSWNCWLLTTFLVLPLPLLSLVPEPLVFLSYVNFLFFLTVRAEWCVGGEGCWGVETWGCWVSSNLGRKGGRREIFWGWCRDWGWAYVGVERIGEDRGKDKGARIQKYNTACGVTWGFFLCRRYGIAIKIKDRLNNNNFIKIIKLRQLEKPIDRNTVVDEQVSFHFFFFFFFFKSTE